MTHAAGVSQQKARRPVITVAGLSKTYLGAVDEAVQELSFAVNEGETLALLGPSGCGKTTTLRLLAGFEAPDAGEVRIRDAVVASATAWVPPERRGLGMVFQQFALFPHLTVRQNVAYGLRGRGRAEKAERVREMLELVSMTEFGERYPHALSGGQQQRAALARALAPRPSVVLMDEPFASLDAGLRSQTRREVKAILTRTGATAIMVTHDQEEAFALADRILVMRAGRQEQLNTPDNIYHRPATRFVAGFVGQADFLPVEVQDNAVVTELGRFGYEGSPPEGAVEMMLRPDDVEICDDGPGEGVVLDREFKRAYNRYSLRLDSGATVRSVTPAMGVYHAGDRVRLRLRPVHVVLFPR